MKIVAVGPLPNNFSVSGLSIAFGLALDGLNEIGHEIRVVDISPSAKGHVSGSLAFSRVYDIAKMSVSFARKIKGADLVYAPMSTSALGLLKDALIVGIASLARKSTVGHLHGGGERAFYRNSNYLIRVLLKQVRRRYGKIIVLGDLLCSEFDYLDSAEQLAVVPNGLPAESEPFGEVGVKRLQSNSPINLLYLSNMVSSKGYLLVLEACARLKAEGVSIYCRFCGSFVSTVVDGKVGNTFEDFQNRIRLLGLENNVEYMGLVRGEKKRDVLRQSHVFVLPTSYPWEGQPISIIEALSWGIPVVSTKHKGIPEQVKDGISGCLIDVAGDASVVAAAIRRLTSSSSVYEEYSIAARRSYLDKFTASKHVKRLEEVLLSVVS